MGIMTIEATNEPWRRRAADPGLAPFGHQVITLPLLGTITGTHLTGLTTNEAKLHQHFKTR